MGQTTSIPKEIWLKDDVGYRIEKPVCLYGMEGNRWHAFPK